MAQQSYYSRAPMKRSLQTIDSFSPLAAELRAHFDARFADPRQATGDRFVWDYWHVPGQYTALRTPAWHYFPKKLYDAFHQQLVWWGRRTLGCHDVSPPWLSNYVDGCEQLMHGDLPHGPWAFVFSLTNWKGRQFKGGETLLLREQVLDFWRSFESTVAVEEGQLLLEVPPLFNRLTVFDPRIPHGVRRVEGVRDPRLGRLVIHGWFVQPRPFVEGPLRTSELQKRIELVTEAIAPALEAGLPVAGMLSLGFEVREDGSTAGLKVLCDTTRVPADHERGRTELLSSIRRAVKGMRFGKQRGPSRVTLPLVFER